MLNYQSIDAVNRSTFGKHFCKPLYDTYCFSNIPNTIKTLLTGTSALSLPPDTYRRDSIPYEHVVLLFIDGFGWCFLEKYQEKYPFLQRFQEQGIASKITSQFPSTTAGHVTCIHTGESINDSGIYEWFHYDPSVDTMISPLLFSFAGDKDQGTLKSINASPDRIYPAHSFYEDLAKYGVDSYVFQHESIIHSTYSNAVCKEATSVISFTTLADAVKKLIEKMKESMGKKSYFFLYWSEIDSTGHHYGPASLQFQTAVDQCFTILENHFWREFSHSSPKTAVLMTADHGQVQTDINRAIYLNTAFPEILPFLQQNRKGKILAPAGSPRDYFLHVKEESLAGVKEILSEGLKGKAEVYFTEELIAVGLFGRTPPSQRLKERIGNLVVLPYEDESVFWFEEGRFSVKFYGNHGGLTRKEMETIFLFI